MAGPSHGQLLLLSVLLVGIYRVSCADVFISNETGDDVEGDGSKAMPYQTFLRAMEQVQSITDAESSIIAMNGTYAGPQNTGLFLSDSLLTFLSIRSEAGDVQVDLAESQSESFFTAHGNDQLSVQFSDITFTSHPGDAHVINVSGLDSINVSHCHFNKV